MGFKKNNVGSSANKQKSSDNTYQLGENPNIVSPEKVIFASPTRKSESEVKFSETGYVHDGDYNEGGWGFGRRSGHFSDNLATRTPPPPLSPVPTYPQSTFHRTERTSSPESIKSRRSNSSEGEAIPPRHEETEHDIPASTPNLASIELKLTRLEREVNMIPILSIKKEIPTSTTENKSEPQKLNYLVLFLLTLNLLATGYNLWQNQKKSGKNWQK